MSKKIAVGVEDFSILKKEGYYVDKTLLIKSILEYTTSTVFLFTRPRRFGKSLTLSMLKSFFEKSGEDKSSLFTDTLIWQDAESRDKAFKYPVIRINMKSCIGKDAKQTYFYIQDVIAREYERLSWLLESSQLTINDKDFFNKILNRKANVEEMSIALRNLITYVSKATGTLPILLIDEYDAPIDVAYQEGYYEEIIGFFRHFYGDALKGQTRFAYAVLTGVLQVSKESLFSGLNNIIVDSVTDSKMSESFGFTEDEVKELLHYYGQDDKFQTVTEWYDNYHFGGATVYNPWSVLSFLQNHGNLQTYWINTGENRLLDKLLDSPSINTLQVFQNILSGDIEVNDPNTIVLYKDHVRSEDELYSFLLATGYLTIKERIGINQFRLGIPNKEVAESFKNDILSRYHPEALPLSSYKNLRLWIEQGDTSNIASFIKNHLLSSFSTFEMNNEKCYQVLVLTLMAVLFEDAFVRSEVDSGLGRLDILIIPHEKDKTGCIFEIKYYKGKISEARLNASSLKALKQIEEKGYVEILQKVGIKSIQLFGFAFNKKKVAVSSKPINLNEHTK